MVAAAQTVPPADLDPESDFRLITPAINDDEGGSDSDLGVSNHSSDIEEEIELRRFTQALQTAQVTALKKENKKKRGMYSKQSKKTLKRRMQDRIELASKGFHPVDEYIKIMARKHNNANAAPTPEFDDVVDPRILLREESEEASDEANALAREANASAQEVNASAQEANALARDTCADRSVNGTSNSGVSEVESEETLPLFNVQPRPRHHARIESEESTEDDDDDARHFEALRLEVLARQEILEATPGSTSQVIRDRSKLREASVQLTNEAKKGDLDVIVRARIAAMVGFLNIYTDDDLGYSWKKSSKIVAKTQGRGTNHARHIREWVMGFMNWRDLPLHQLNRKRGTIIDDEDVAEEIKSRMKKKTKEGFLKAQDIVEIVASPDMQAILAQKGISKPTISVKTALRWLEKLGWSYGKLKNGMYLDGHERSDVVEYRRAFVERWMQHERRFHRWDHDGTELPRPNGFPVPGANGRFRLILVTHDESTFFQNDERNTGWSHATSKSKPKAKGNGQTLMVSDFLTPDWGRLRDGDE
jgi:hypothetical protein